MKRILILDTIFIFALAILGWALAFGLGSFVLAFIAAIPVWIFKAFKGENNTQAVQSKNHLEDRRHEANEIFEYDHEDYCNGHSEKAWRSIGLKVSTKYKTTAKKNYTFKEVESSNSLRYLHLTKNQRKVKILGDALVKNTKSKRRARDILISQYAFKNNTAEYAVGYEGYNDW
jgi:ABC-type transport system involved in cytochrome bd biosynthesis fused ATPase/permease subunit